MLRHSINYRELFVIVTAVEIWGEHWKNKQIVVLTDNKPICDIWHSGSGKQPTILHLLRHLFFTAARLNINIMFEHILGNRNVLADLLSRLQVHRFRQLAPDMDQDPTPVPSRIWHI